MHKVKGFDSDNIICKKCGCIDECQYYEETVKPVVKAYDSIGECANEEFECNLIILNKGIVWNS